MTLGMLTAAALTPDQNGRPAVDEASTISAPVRPSTACKRAGPEAMSRGGEPADARGSAWIHHRQERRRCAGPRRRRDRAPRSLAPRAPSTRTATPSWCATSCRMMCRRAAAAARAWIVCRRRLASSAGRRGQGPRGEFVEDDAAFLLPPDRHSGRRDHGPRVVTARAIAARGDRRSAPPRRKRRSVPAQMLRSSAPSTLAAARPREPVPTTSRSPRPDASRQERATRSVAETSHRCRRRLFRSPDRPPMARFRDPEAAGASPPQLRRWRGAAAEAHAEKPAATPDDSQQPRWRFF